MMKDKIKEILLKPQHRDVITDELIEELYILFLRELYLAEVVPFIDTKGKSHE